MHSSSSEHRSHTRRSARLIATLACIGALTACAGSRETEPPPATAATEPEPAAGLPPADPATLKEDHRAIDRAANTSERLADQTAAEAPNARDHANPPAGLPRTAATPDETTESNTATAADNTAKNERDRAPGALTPEDQSNKPSDLELAAKIRRAIVGADGLSFTARNVKIITEGGRVTLRGAVKSADEKARVEQTARKAAGPARVVSELEVEK
jgi:hyperosmotically inducible periplasmic protein